MNDEEKYLTFGEFITILDKGLTPEQKNQEMSIQIAHERGVCRMFEILPDEVILQTQILDPNKGVTLQLNDPKVRMLDQLRETRENLDVEGQRLIDLSNQLSEDSKRFYGRK